MSLHLPWRVAIGSGQVHPIIDRDGDEVCRCYDEDDAAAIVQTMNRIAQNQEIGRAILGQWKTPTAEAVVEALAQGRDDRRRAMGVTVPNRHGVPLLAYEIQEFAAGKWRHLSSANTADHAWAMVPDGHGNPVRMVTR
jgi:hypothetical protein